MVAVRVEVAGRLIEQLPLGTGQLPATRNTLYERPGDVAQIRVIDQVANGERATSGDERNVITREILGLPIVGAETPMRLLGTLADAPESIDHPPVEEEGFVTEDPPRPPPRRDELGRKHFARWRNGSRGDEPCA